MSYINYPDPKPEDYKNMLSETAKYRHLTTPYCKGAGVDIASQGDPVVPWAMSFDLPEKEFMEYSGGNKPKGVIHLRGFADNLPFDECSLDFVYSSHLLEDYLDWLPVLNEWVSVLKFGGYLIVLVPDKDLWAAALARGQAPNCSHKHESHAGELSTYAKKLGLKVIDDRLTNCFPGDYTVMFIAKKI